MEDSITKNGISQDINNRRLLPSFSSWFWCIAIALLILIGTRSSVFTLGALVVSALFIISADMEKALCVLFFLLPYATIFKIGSGGTSFFTYIELLFVILYFIKNKFQATREEMYIILFVMFLAINELLNGTLNITVTIKFFCYLIMIIAAVNCEFQNDNRTLFLSYILGFISSSFARLYGSSIFNINRIIVMKQERVNGEYITRFSGLYTDPNYYVINLIIAMTLVIILFRKKSINLAATIILMAPMVYFTALTGSKSGLFMLAIVAVFFIWQCFAKRHYFLGCVVIALGLVAGNLLLSGRFEIFSNTFARLSVQSAGLTSGRSDVWALYMNYFNAHPLRLILGRSIGYFSLNGEVAHNTYIDLIYELGFVGTFILLFLLGHTVYYPVQIKRGLLNYSILIVILIMYFFLSELQYFDPAFHISLAIIVLNMDMNTDAVSAEREELAQS